MNKGWTEYGKSWLEFSKEFEGEMTGLLYEGTHGTALIGDENNYGSPCSCCSNSSDLVVYRYKRVYWPE